MSEMPLSRLSHLVLGAYLCQNEAWVASAEADPESYSARRRHQLIPKLGSRGFAPMYN